MKSSLTSIGGLAAAIAAVGLAAGCGGGGSSHGVKGAQTSVSSSAQQQIKQNWIAFFSPKTSAADKAKLLQNGQRFEPVIKAEASSPLAKQTQATVSKVTLQGSKKARVIYSVSLAGKPALTHRTGTAVKTNGVWQVGDSSFCALLGLAGSAPKACTASLP